MQGNLCRKVLLELEFIYVYAYARVLGMLATIMSLVGLCKVFLNLTTAFFEDWNTSAACVLWWANVTVEGRGKGKHSQVILLIIVIF